jgi:hypothetical protein
MLNYLFFLFYRLYSRLHRSVSKMVTKTTKTTVLKKGLNDGLSQSADEHKHVTSTLIQNIVTTTDKEISQVSCPRCKQSNMAVLRIGEWKCKDCGASLSKGW